MNISESKMGLLKKVQCYIFPEAKSSLGKLKGRRKEKECPTPPPAETTGDPQYLSEECVCERVIDVDFTKLVDKPEDLDYNEWLATHTISFFNHINMLYSAISEFCTCDCCSSMHGLGNIEYLWMDEKGKRNRCPAPQYIDYVTSFIQKSITEETLFPTKIGNVFPSCFESITRNIHMYMLHILGHIYHAHYDQLIMLGINGHLNSLFLHFIIFNHKFSLLDDKETEVYKDLIAALMRPRPDRNQNDDKSADKNSPEKDTASRSNTHLNDSESVHVSDSESPPIEAVANCDSLPRNEEVLLT